MTIQISTALAGNYDAPNYQPPNNITSAPADDSNVGETRRYTKFDRSATEAGTMTDFSFGDFLDMINPLEHIPVISSIYREITGETINPVSRVVGNIIYGGPMGIPSAVLAAAGGAAEATLEQSTGKDSIGNVIAALFGPDDKSGDTSAPATQLADAGKDTAPAAASASTPAPTSAQSLTPGQINARGKLMASAVAAAAASSAQASMPSFGKSSPAAQMAGASAAGSGLVDQLAGNSAMSLPLAGGKTFALDPKKLPYGGVMAPPLQGNNMAIALANAAPGMQMNHTVYTGRTFNGVRPQLSNTPAPASAPTSAPVASAVPPSPPASAPLALPPAPASDTYVSTAAPDELPASLMSDIAALRAINTYRNTASQTGGSSGGINIIN